MPLPQQRDPEATRRQLAPWLARRMPQARDLAITNLAPPAATGFSNDTLLFDLEWTEDGRARRLGMVVRIEPSGFTVFPAYDVGQQFRIMQRLGETTDVPVPPMYWLEERTAALGSPEQDVAWWLFLDRHHSEGIGIERLAGLPGREETVARYEELMGRPVRHLDYYEVFAAFRFAVIMCRLWQLLIAYGAVPADADPQASNIPARLLAGMLGR